MQLGWSDREWHISEEETTPAIPATGAELTAGAVRRAQTPPRRPRMQLRPLARSHRQSATKAPVTKPQRSCEPAAICTGAVISLSAARATDSGLTSHTPGGCPAGSFTAAGRSNSAAHMHPAGFSVYFVPPWRNAAAQSKPRVECVVCTSPKRAYYRHSPSRGIKKSANRVTITGRR